jgi:hypothetical protein
MMAITASGMTMRHHAVVWPCETGSTPAVLAAIPDIRVSPFRAMQQAPGLDAVW